MSDKLEFKLVIEESGKQVYSHTLSYDSVASIVSNYEDNSRNNDFFALAAKHPASTVRENVAYKDKISEEIVNHLINDTSISVLRNLIRSEAFKEHASHDVVEKLVKFDIEIAQNVAGDFEAYQQANSTKLCAALMALSDPSISYSLAGNYNAPKKLLKELQNHKDPYVASEARRRLED
jgi:hypothetical protein